jgi:hypothetical protein
VNPFFGLELTSAPVNGPAPGEQAGLNDYAEGRYVEPLSGFQAPASPNVRQASALNGETGAVPTLPPEFAAEGGSGLTYAGTVELNGIIYNRFEDSQGNYLLVQPVVQQTREITITAEVPFDRPVSDPAAVEAAENRGRVQAGDVEQFFKGAYNALVDLVPIFSGPILGPVAKAAEIPKAPIDPRFGGAALAGGQIAEALALEGASKLPEVGAAFGKTLESDLELVDPAVHNPFETEGPLAAAGELPAAAGGSVIPKNLQLNIQAHASVSNVVRSLRNLGTDEAVATAKLIARGEVKVEFAPNHPGAGGYYVRGSNTLSVTKLGLAGTNRQVAGIVGHEAYHFLQDVPGSRYTIFEEVEAYTFQEIVFWPTFTPPLTD